MSWGPPPPRRPGMPPYRPRTHWQQPYQNPGFGYGYYPPRRSGGGGVVVAVLLIVIGVPALLILGGLVAAFAAVTVAEPPTTTSTYAPTSSSSSYRPSSRASTRPSSTRATSRPSYSRVPRTPYAPPPSDEPSYGPPTTRPAQPPTTRPATTQPPTTQPPTTRPPTTQPPTTQPPTTQPPTTQPPNNPGSQPRGSNTQGPPRVAPSSEDAQASRLALWQRKPRQSECAKIRPVTGTRADQQVFQQWARCAAEIHPNADVGGIGQPSVQVYWEEADSPCGRAGKGNGWVAFYCPANNRIYMDLKESKRASDAGFDVGNLQTLFHEYAHHIQHSSGLMLHRTQASDRDRGIRLNELQAECFGGMALRYSNNWDHELWSRAKFKNSKHYGIGENRKQWIIWGANAENYGMCNTYNVPDQYVQ